MLRSVLAIALALLLLTAPTWAQTPRNDEEEPTEEPGSLWEEAQRLYERAKEAAESNAEETRLLVRLPEGWRATPLRLSIHGSLGHHLEYLDRHDILEEVDANHVRFRWDRALPAETEGVNPNLLQRSGDFRIWYETELWLGIDYFHVPRFDSAGAIVEDPDYSPDRNSPYRQRAPGLFE